MEVIAINSKKNTQDAYFFLFSFEKCKKSQIFENIYMMTNLINKIKEERVNING